MRSADLLLKARVRVICNRMHKQKWGNMHVAVVVMVAVVIIICVNGRAPITVRVVALLIRSYLRPPFLAAGGELGAATGGVGAWGVCPFARAR